MSVDYCSDSINSDSAVPQYARITFFDQDPYLMKKERVIIGRNSAAGSVDIDVGTVTFVSRKHLELTYSYQKLKIKCLGKNGIFINNNFKPHSFIPYELPPKCTLRFPSTNVQFYIEQLIGIESDDDTPDYKRMKMNSYNDIDSTLNYNRESHFNGFREVIGNLTDDEVEEFMHNEIGDNVQRMNGLYCDGFMNDTNGDNIWDDGLVTVLNSDDITIEHGSDIQKPPYSYAQLIVQAVSTGRDRQLTLNGIYSYISKNYPYFKAHDKGWQNSVRHNLSLNRYFIKVARRQNEPGKGSFWRVDPSYENKLMAQAFRKRRLRNNSAGSFNENRIVPQVLTISSIESGSPGVKGNVFGVSKSGPLTTAVNQTRSSSNAITFIRACDIKAQKQMSCLLSESSNDIPQKYSVSRRKSLNSNAYSDATDSLSLKSVFFDGSNSKITTPSTISSTGNNPGTLISVDGKLYSTVNLNSVPYTQPNSPSRTSNHGNKSFKSTNSMKVLSVRKTLQKKGQNYYIVSQSPTMNTRSNSLSSLDENVTVRCQMPSANANRRIINIHSRDNVHVPSKGFTNENMNSEVKVKSSIILKKVNIYSDYANDDDAINSANTVTIVDRNSDCVSDDRNYRYGIGGRQSDCVIVGNGDSEGDRSDIGGDNCEGDQFLIAHSDTALSGVHSQERSESCSLPYLY